MSKVNAQKSYADSGAAPLEAAANKLLTTIERQADETLAVAQARAAEITRAAEKRAAQILDQAHRTPSKTPELKSRRRRAFGAALNGRVKTQGGFEKLRSLHLQQQAELERAGVARIANTQLWVHNQDEALEFYTAKVGLEVRADVILSELGDLRWLAVGPAGGPEIAIVLLAIPGPSRVEPDTNKQVRRHMARGFESTIFLSTGDCYAAYTELKGRGVEFIEHPQESPDGMGASFRDPSGNLIRLIQGPDTEPVEPPPPARIRARAATRLANLFRESLARRSA